MNTNTGIEKANGRTAWLIRLSRFAILGIPVFAAVGFLLDLRNRQGSHDGVWYLVSLAFTIFVGNRLLPIILAASFSALTLIGYFFSPPGIASNPALAHCFMGISILWVMAALIVLRKQAVRVMVQHENTLRSTEGALRESERCQRAIFDNITDPAWLKDREGRLVAVNPAWCKFTGFTADQVIGKNIGEIPALYSAEVAKVLMEEDAAIMANGKPCQNELRREAPDGSVIWLETSKSALVDEDGKIYGLAGTARNISQRKASEAALRKLAIAVEQSPASIVMTDVLGRIEYVNPKFCSLTGYSREEVRGQNPRLLKAPETSAESYRQLWATITAGQEWHGEFHNRKKNGELYWEFASISPIRDELGKITHFVGVKEDITQRKLLAMQIEQLRSEREIILNTIGEGVHWIDAEGRVKFENPSAARMLGYEAGELVGQPSHATLHHTHEDGSAYAPGDCPAIMTQRDGVIRRVTGEVFWRKNGSSFPVEYSCTPVYEGDGRSAGTVVIFTDVTARKRAEAEVGNLERKVAVHLENEQLARRALAREQELNLIKSRFVRLVSHEFRTPLSVINGAAQLLSQYAGRMTEEECQQELKEIEQATGRMTTMMNDLLLHGRLEAGKMECHPAPVDVEMLCRQIIQETSHLTWGSNAVEFTLSPAARGAVLDRKIFQHILGHLLSNAVKYSLSGQPVRLEVERVDTQTPPAGILEPRAADYLEIKVSDSGIGIPAADMAKIFQTFHRAANVGNRPGTGMGLAIVKHFVELHRGGIRIQSQAGQGTCVTLWLPTNPN